MTASALPALSSSEPPPLATLSQFRPRPTTCSRMPESSSASRVCEVLPLLVEDDNRWVSSSLPNTQVDPKLGRLRETWNSPKILRRHMTYSRLIHCSPYLWLRSCTRQPLCGDDHLADDTQMTSSTSLGLPLILASSFFGHPFPPSPAPRSHACGRHSSISPWCGGRC